MAVERTRSKLSVSEIRGLVKDLPKALTHVRVSPKIQKLRDIFWSSFAKSFFKKASENYQKKAAGGSDEYGVRWKPLSKATLIRRAKGSLASLAKKRNKGSANNIILVRTGRLRDSFKPGQASGSSSYKPVNEDQVFELGRGRMKIGSAVPYADDQDKTRPLLGNEGRLIEDALKEAQKDLVKELKLLLK